MLAVFYSHDWQWLGAMSAEQDACELYGMINALRLFGFRGLRIVLADGACQREAMRVRFD